MDISLYLGRFFGLYLLIVGVALVIRRESIGRIVHEFIKNPALLMIVGIMSLILGLLFVLAHNIWVLNWRLLVTLLAYLTLVKGIIRLYFPEVTKKLAMTLERNHGLRISGVVSVILGIYLIISTFFSLD